MKTSDVFHVTHTFYLKPEARLSRESHTRTMRESFESKRSVLMTYHYSDLCEASDWLILCSDFLRAISNQHEACNVNRQEYLTGSNLGNLSTVIGKPLFRRLG